ncbi:uncharacterized protein PHALS_06939 [Plasmopara halstedii]|uniref:Uncharacterized protein n=1 Tax=Plasmopara halstedii TaxID=4781 RepID=A0A0P1B631_PLAHL|nr:uncharacterized protein PHALS_06939 [Plasmopara halstedii]CEG49160.1 hypothetical protein PHALS_06939 [Plasmopara halstedii]|eukprot:XP_024585529.1 hypothetical protein PHALS_06939 [Plasmopara halstedii]
MQRERSSRFESNAVGSASSSAQLSQMIVRRSPVLRRRLLLKDFRKRAIYMIDCSVIADFMLGVASSACGT